MPPEYAKTGTYWIYILVVNRYDIWQIYAYVCVSLYMIYREDTVRTLKKQLAELQSAQQIAGGWYDFILYSHL